MSITGRATIGQSKKLMHPCAGRSESWNVGRVNEVHDWMYYAIPGDLITCIKQTVCYKPGRKSRLTIGKQYEILNIYGRAPFFTVRIQPDRLQPDSYTAAYFTFEVPAGRERRPSDPEPPVYVRTSGQSASPWWRQTKPEPPRERSANDPSPLPGARRIKID